MENIWATLVNSIEFRNPEFLVVVPIAALLLIFGLAISLVGLKLRPTKTHGSSYPLLGHVKFWFFVIVALAVLAVAAARPFLAYGGSSFKRGDVDVAVVVDGSASMWVKDLGSSRLEIAVREALNLYTQEILTPGDRVALFVFGTTTVRRVHLSSIAERFVEQVGDVGPPEVLSGDAFPWDSDISTAFEHVYQSLDSQDRFEAGDDDWRPEERSDRLVLLFTDGDFIADAEQTARLDQALIEFQRRGVKVYPIGIASRREVDLSVILQDYVRGADYDASLESDLQGLSTRLNTEDFGMLEQRTGGRSFIIDSAGVSSSTFLRNVIDSHRSIAFQLIPAEDKQEVWQWVVALAVVIFVVAMLFY